MKSRGGNGAILSGAIKEFLVHWDRTASSWKDQARSGFEREFLQELLATVRSASNAAKQIEELLHQVHKECS